MMYWKDKTFLYIIHLGVSEFPPSTATPSGLPLTHNVVIARSGLSHMGLAGAYRCSMISLLVGAALPCTASRRCRDYARSYAVTRHSVEASLEREVSS